MKADDQNSPARYETLNELIIRAAALKLTVTISVHDCPTATALEWLQLGLLDGIEPGAGGTNPPTGIMESGWPGAAGGAGMTTAHVYTDAPRLTQAERQAAIDRVAEELATNTALLDELRRHEDEGEES